MERIDNYINEVKIRIKNAEKRIHLYDAFNGLITALTVSALLLFLLASSQLLGNFSSDVRTFQFYLWLLLTVAILIFYFLIPIFKSQFLINKPEYLKVSESLGNLFPEIKDELKNSLQLLEEQSESYSDELINASFKSVYSKCRKLDFNTIVDFRFLKSALLKNGLLIISIFILLLFMPLNNGLYKLWNFDRDFVIPPKFKFEVEPGNVTITKGDLVEISVKAVGEAPKEISIYLKSIDKTDFEPIISKRDSNGLFKYRLNNVLSSFKYFASSEEIESEVFNVEVINRPVISSFNLKVIPPAYSKLSAVVQKDNGNISILKGSKVELNLSATKELNSAEIVFQNGKNIAMICEGSNAGADFNVMLDDQYRIVIQDTMGNENANPITYSISVFDDKNPVIEMLLPNKDTKLKDNDKQPLVVKIGDDYGFTKLLINYRLSQSDYEVVKDEFNTIEIPFNKNLKENDIYYTWDLAPMRLATNDVVSYYLEIFDNDFVSGPKSASTKIFNVRVPSLDELFEETDETHELVQDDLEKTLKEALELKEEFEQISNELKKDSKKINWQEKENIEQALEKFEQLQDKIDDVSKKMAEMQNELRENNLLSEETMKKYMELQELFDEMKDSNMLEAMKKMQNMLKDMNREDVKASLEDLKKNEDVFQKSIERTINLLKRVQVEQKTDEINKRIEDLLESQEELREETEKSDLSDKQSKENLEKQQNEITEKMKNLSEEMKNLEEKMSELDDMPKEQMQQMNSEMLEQKNEELSEQAVKEMQQMMKAQAMQQMSKIEENMEQMQQSMQQMQSSMEQQNAVKTYSEMMKITSNLLQLSREQENLNEETKKLSSNSPQLKEKARKQSEIEDDLGKTIQQMSELAQQSFAISPEMGQALGKSRQDMDKAISGMQDRPNNKNTYNSSMNSAMAGINKAAVLMKNAMNKMMDNGGQGQGGGGMMSLMQQLQNFSQQQMALNQLTQALKQGGKLSPQQQQQLQRLSEQQELIRKSLDQLNKEAKESGQSKKLAGNLDKILDEMQEVVSGLRTEKLNDDLVQTQERILNKLLDAQRSINERDFEKDRKSFAGKNIFRESPPEILFKTEERRNKLRDELLKAIKEGYLKDYEELIRKYFEILESEKKTVVN